MQTTEQLIQAAGDPRLRKQPVWVRLLVEDLANRLRVTDADRNRIRERATQEVDQARALLQEGPADSDTYMDLPYSQVDSGTDDFEQRPLGKGTNIEFRGPGDEPGEGISVKWAGDHLTVHGINHLAVLPVGPTLLIVKAV